MAYQQAGIAVQSEAEFQSLKQQIESALGAASAERYLAAMVSSGLRARDFAAVLSKGVIDKVSPAKEKAADVYGRLPLSDQAQIREFYLTAIEQVPAEARRKHSKVFRYE